MILINVGQAGLFLIGVVNSVCDNNAFKESVAFPNVTNYFDAPFRSGRFCHDI